jgi:hypothetical protein
MDIVRTECEPREARRVAWWSISTGAESVPVYVDEIMALETDALLFGSVARVSVVAADDRSGI